VTFAVRPEKLRIAQNLDDAMQQNRATGRVLQSVYGGSSITYKVNCNEQVVTVFEQNREAQPVGLGEQVTLSWSPQHSIVVEV